jgi:hypothetical protein
MANELTTNFRLQYAKGGDSFSLSNIQLQQTVAASPRVQGVQDIGTSEEAIILGDVSADGGAFFAQNLDATNYVEIGLTGSYVIKLKPGEYCFLCGVSDKDLFARANTAAIKLAYALFSP